MGSNSEDQECFKRHLEAEILKGNVDFLEDFLNKIPELSNERKKVLLETAVCRNNRDVALCLPRHEIFPRTESAIFASLTQAFKTLLAGCSDLTSYSGKRLLHVAVSANPRLIPLLADAGCDVNARDLVHGNTPLHTACIQFKEEAVFALVQAGARVNEVNNDLKTPLYVLLRLAHAARKSAFHAKSRQNLAVSLIHMGFRLVATPEEYVADKQFYRVSDLHRRLLRSACRVASLQHFCRVKIRQVCEVTAKVKGQTIQSMVLQLEVSQHLVNYLLFRPLSRDLITQSSVGY